MTELNSAAVANVNELKPTKSNRVWEIDFLRGVCIILMVFDHIMWQIHDFIWRYFDIGSWSNPSIPTFLVNYHNFGSFYYLNNFRIVFRTMVLFLFFFISGISINFSKNNAKRGCLCLGCGIIITIITSILCACKVTNIQDHLIMFGVLSCLGSSILITYFLRKLVYKLTNNNLKIWIGVAFVLSWVLILLGKYFEKEFPYYYIQTSSPLSWFRAITGNILGFSRFGGDYFPLVPYLAYMIIGCVIGEIVYKNKESLFKKQPKWCIPFSYVGKKTLWIYLLHIPIITLIHAIIFLACGFHITF